jgi:hypothetical protein
MDNGDLWSIIAAITALQAPIYICLGFIVKQIIDLRVAVAEIHGDIRALDKRIDNDTKGNKHTVA